MRILLLSVLALTGLSFSGCRSVTVVADRPVHRGHASVYYASGRPYYYSGRTRHWGYPSGYVHRSRDRSYDDGYYGRRSTRRSYIRY